MLPAVNASVIPAPPSFVATPIPGNQTAHVPPDNVSPPVSNVEIRNNNKGNGGGTTAAPPPQSAAIPLAPAINIPAFLRVSSPTLGAGASTAFVTQMIGQDTSQAAKSILVEYEELIALSYVKYRPSNATLPPPEPVGLFGKLLQQEKSSVATQQSIVTKAATESAPATTLAATQTPAPRPAVVTERGGKPAPSSTTPAKSSAENAYVSPVKAVSAYAQSVRRATPEENDAVGELA